jgi:hypothetical protein
LPIALDLTLLYIISVERMINKGDDTMEELLDEMSAYFSDPENDSFIINREEWKKMSSYVQSLWNNQRKDNK